MSLFMHPWFLLLLPVVPWLVWLNWKRGSGSAIGFSSAPASWNLRPTLRQRLSWLPMAWSLASLTLMIFAMARPREGKERAISTSEGIAIELVVDRSSSMRALDFQIDGNRVDRLDAVKRVAADFVKGDSRFSLGGTPQLAGRGGDRIGLIVFAGFADALTTPTLDHSFLVGHLAKVGCAETREEDGTAIGDAIALAVEKLSGLQSVAGNEIKSKVIILLTDGENTAGDMEPGKAAELAKTLGIKVYTIGVGTKGEAPFPVRQLRDGRIQVQYVQVNIDEETLQSIAEETGGKYFRATDTDSLTKIYAEINELEQTEFQTDRFVDYRELAVQDFSLFRWRFPGLVWIAATCLLISQLLRHTFFRRLA